MSHPYRHDRPTIGILAGWQFSWTATPLSYLEPIFRGACLAAQEMECNLILGCGMGSWTNRRASLRPAWPLVSPGTDFVPIGPWNTDGLIAINPLHSPERSRYVQDLIAAGHPVLFIASGEEGPKVSADNRGGILEAVAHLVEHGHRDIAFIAGTSGDLEGDSGERLRAYNDAVTMYGLSDDPRLVTWGRHVYEGGYAAIQELLASGVAFTAVVASNDESALGAMQALREADLSVPQDVAIIGFDDRPESAVQDPPLSSVRVPLRKIGYLAVESLFEYVTGRIPSLESLRVPTHLVVRGSCGCCRSHGRAAKPENIVLQTEGTHSAADLEQLVSDMASPILNEAEHLSADEVEAFCWSLVDAFLNSINQNDPVMFQEALETVLQQVMTRGGKLHTWQIVVSRLGEAFDTGMVSHPQSSTHVNAHVMLDQARVTISESFQRQYLQHVVDQRWTLNRLGSLTARLLAALDENQVYEVLTHHLQAMGVRTGWIALFEAENHDPVAWTTLRIITSPEHPVYCFRSREFPPPELLPTEHPFSLALFPLTGPRGQMGYIAFDTVHLTLYGAIAQEVATALNSAQLYRDAREGRRLAEQANELKSRFLSTVSHELRTPLNLIMGLSRILLEESDESDVPLPESYRKDVEQIYASAQLLGGLIGDVLDLASSDAGQLRLAKELVDLSEALRLVAETGRQLAAQKGLTWHADLPGSGPWVWGDLTRLRQIVLNLVNNAVKFTTEGEVRLTLETSSDADSDSGFVTVSVSDTGLGIPPEEQALIFDEFRRSERSMAGDYGGLGLGLAICRRLVEMHGGTIGLHSSGEEGAGSTFFFTLPTVQPPADQTQPSDRPTFTAESVLVLTHRLGCSARLREHLSEHGFDVQTVFVDEAADWLSWLVMSPPGAVVIDVTTTPHQGWYVLKSIKGHPRTRHLPVLFCSLSQDEGSVLEFDYLTKPIELTDLKRALDQHWLPSGGDDDFKTILVVDDDPNTLEMHARIVRANSPSHRVLKAHNGLEALEILDHETVDLVLLDLMMPVLDGFGVLKAMRSQEKTRQVPVIVLTGQVLTEKEMERLNRGVATVLSKGVFSLEETLAHVDTVLERSRELSAETQRLVRQAMAYIHEHYADQISRTDLAQYVALSEDYLTFCFRKELGVTPITYLNRFRVNQAKDLLVHTNKSITEIALDVGFSDSSYFSRVFRREVGLSPTDYRHN
ncbi:MAG: substrate-binding domain-containing protein [Anaerolineae bacterium]